jgi:acyl carrier protein
MYLDDVKQILIDILNLQDHEMNAQTRLLGSIPELDSMAVVSVITALEEHFGISVEDDEISAATFESVGSLADFVASKLG